MIKRSYSWYLILLNYETSILLIRHDNYDICINNKLNNYEQGKCRLGLKLFCNFILSERINKVYIYNITASMFSLFLLFIIFFIYLFIYFRRAPRALLIAQNKSSLPIISCLGQQLLFFRSTSRVPSAAN